MVLTASWIGMQCHLCGVYRAYLPNEIFQADLSMEMLRKPIVGTMAVSYG
jgi:hypothetical protein